MDTSLKADTIHGVQPTKIQDYMLSRSQIPKEKSCTSQKLPANCAVRHFRHAVVDTESKLRGLDRPISKVEVVPKASLDDPTNDVQSNRSKVVESFTPFEPESTREKRPCNVLSGVTIDRFENPLIPAQNTQHIIFEESHRGGLHSRLSSKDCNVKECGKLLKLKPVYGSRCST